MAIAIAVVLAVIGAGSLWYGQRVWRTLTRGAAPVAEPEPELDEITPAGPLGPDQLVFLFPERFVGTSATAGGMAGTVGTAPLTDETVALDNQANRLIYAILVDQYQASRLEFRLVERAPSMMPPCPQKAWALEMRRADALSASPLLDCLNVAFNVLYSKRRIPAGPGAEQEPEQLWVSLDELIEQVLKVARAEISFWKRQGVYADLCNYVEEALIAAGYMRELARGTWLERLRGRRLQINRQAIEERRSDADDLHRCLVEFRCTHGSEQTREMAEDLTSPSKEADSELATDSGPLDELPLDDALRLSIYETLHCLRQLEPSGGA